MQWKPIANKYRKGTMKSTLHSECAILIFLKNSFFSSSHLFWLYKLQREWKREWNRLTAKLQYFRTLFLNRGNCLSVLFVRWFVGWFVLFLFCYKRSGSSTKGEMEWDEQKRFFIKLALCNWFSVFFLVVCLLLFL